LARNALKLRRLLDEQSISPVEESSLVQRNAASLIALLASGRKDFVVKYLYVLDNIVEISLAGVNAV
jgi:hypothetical protein